MKTMAPARYRAKQFAQRAGVAVRTLHLYDERGLLRPAERLENGYRLYGDFKRPWSERADSFIKAAMNCEA